MSDANEGILAFLDVLKNVPGFEQTRQIILGSIGDATVQDVLKKLGKEVIGSAEDNEISLRECVISTLNVVSCLCCVLVPGAGKVVAACLKAGSLVLNYFWKRYEEKKEEIAKEIDENLRCKAEQIIEGFIFAEQCYISAYDAKDSLTISEASHLTARFEADLKQSRDFLYELKFEANKLSKSTTYEVLKNVEKLFTLYVRVAAAQSSLLMRMYSLFQTKIDDLENCTSFSELKRIMEHNDLKHKEYFKVLTEPRLDTIHLFSYFNPSFIECQEIRVFAEIKGIKFQDLYDELAEGEFTLRTLSMPRDQFVIMSSNPRGTLWTSKSPKDDQELFTFRVISRMDNIFAIFSSRWKACCVSSSNSVCRSESPGQLLITFPDTVKKFTWQDDLMENRSLHWKIIKIEGVYVFLSIQDPRKFAYVSSILFGDMKIKKIDPKCPAGFWILQKRKPFSIDQINSVESDLFFRFFTSAVAFRDFFSPKITLLDVMLPFNYDARLPNFALPHRHFIENYYSYVSHQVRMYKLTLLKSESVIKYLYMSLKLPSLLDMDGR